MSIPLVRQLLGMRQPDLRVKTWQIRIQHTVNVGRAHTSCLDAQKLQNSRYRSYVTVHYVLA
jgi:hypothetical protein